MYAFPAWAVTADRTRILNLLLKKCVKYGYSKKCMNLSELIELGDDKLFAYFTKSAHCAHYLLPPTNLLSILSDQEAEIILCQSANMLSIETL